MAKDVTAIDDDDDLPPTGRKLTRERLKGFVSRHYSTRVHMSLILASCGLTAMIASWTLLHLGVRSMLLRYPVAMGLAYATFLGGVWVWLKATGLLGEAREGDPGKARKAKSGSSDWSNFSTGSSSGSSGGGGGGAGAVRGGGGTFDGGGASSSFAEGRAPMAAMGMQQQSAVQAAAPRPVSSSSSSSKGGGGMSLDIDGDGIVLIILAIVVVAMVFIASGYLIWSAPDVLTEAAFGAALTGTLARPAQSAESWVTGVVKKTWWPFAIVFAAAMAFAGWSHANYPKASTFRQALVMAIHNDHGE